MDYLDLQKYIEADNNLFFHIEKNIKFHEVCLERKRKITFENNELILVKKGVIAEVNSDGYFLDTIHTKEAFIFNTFKSKRKLVLESLEETKLLVIDHEQAFTLLEKEGLLSHLFFILLKSAHDATSYFNKLCLLRPHLRVLFVIGKYCDIEKGECKLPRWLTVINLSRLSHCSITTASKVLNASKQKGGGIKPYSDKEMI